MKIGKQTILLENKPKILKTASVVGPKESEGPINIYFDKKIDDALFGETSFEKAESKLIIECISLLLDKVPCDKSSIDYIFCGDLLNQCISTGYAARELGIPLFGLYGACSTFIEGLILASLFVNADYGAKVIAAASSHFCSAERQFRAPLEQGTQKTPSSQVTVTGSGSALVVKNKNDIKAPIITYVTPGKIIDMGIKDISNMGAAMAPAAFDTIVTHLEDTGRNSNYYDYIITGDLGVVGSKILIELLESYGIDISKNHVDCGNTIFDTNKKEFSSGGSGCGCCATVFSSYFYELLKTKKVNKLLVVATGALMSPISTGQGESIPSIAHAICIENEVKN